MEDWWYWLDQLQKPISLWIAFFLTTLRIHGPSYGSSRFDFCMTTHTRVSTVCKVKDNRTACRCHDIQFSEQQWNDYGTNLDRIQVHKYSTSPVTFWSRKQSKNMATQACLHSLTTFSTSFVISIQSRPSVLSEIHMFCRARFPISFPCFSLPDF